MPSFTVQNIVDRAASIADMHDNFIQPSEWLAWFNVERRALAVTMARGATMREMTFTTVPAGQADLFQLTGEFLAVVGVWEIKEDNRLRQLREVPVQDNLFQIYPGGPIHGLSQTFSIEELNSADGINVRFFPADVGTANQYLIVTIKSPTVAAALTDSFSLPMGLEERIVLGMGKKARIKEETDVAEVNQLIQEIDQKVEEYMWGRAFAQAPSVRNVDATQRGWGWGWDSNFVPPTPDMWTWL